MPQEVTAVSAQVDRGVRPHVWIVEWGAISLPLGDPSRITAMLAHHTREEAEQALAEVSEEFNAHMFMAGDLDAERERCAKALEHFAAVSEERGGTDLGAALRDMAELCRRLGLGPNK